MSAIGLPMEIKVTRTTTSSASLWSLNQICSDGASDAERWVEDCADVFRYTEIGLASSSTAISGRGLYGCQ